jgi:hypothetical protein
MIYSFVGPKDQFGVKDFGNGNDGTGCIFTGSRKDDSWSQATKLTSSKIAVKYLVLLLPFPVMVWLLGPLTHCLMLDPFIASQLWSTR